MKSDSKTSRKAPEKGVEPSIHKQKRALMTRQHLFESARRIFARDGFESARIEDIAADAGKTRGAFYANFKDKEDVFFLLFEEQLDRTLEKVRPILKKIPTLEGRLSALADFLCQLGKDRQRTLLNLEFKLYAIRHPRRRRRLADLHAVVLMRCALPEIDELLPAITHNVSVRRSLSLAVGAVMDGLALNQLFDPASISDEDVTHFLKLSLREKIRRHK